jgi:chemotaxis protein methyltransferase CheR
VAFTFFFRDNQTLDLIAQHALPELKRRNYINVWDAGCAHGPEPYSLAIVLRENMGHFLFRNVRIFATDIDEGNFGPIIARGAYRETDLKRIPADILSKYFVPDGEPGYLRVCDDIRQSVQFERHDLLSLNPPRQGFGLIMCKNVLLHFTPEERVAVIRMFHRTLSEGGYFVTEQTQKLPPGTESLFRQVTTAAQLFQKVDERQIDGGPIDESPAKETTPRHESDQPN